MTLGPSQDAGGEQAPNSPGNEVDCALDIVQLIREHHADVYRYAFRLAGAQNDAEDLAQQTFLIAQQKLHQVRDPAKARSWLLTIARNCYLKQRRRPTPDLAGSLALEVDRIPDESIPPAGAEGEWIDREWLLAALGQLTDDHKVVLMMFYFEELSYKEIGDRLGVAIGTVMSRLARAKSRLRELLEAAAGSEGGPTKAPSIGMFV